MYLWRRLATEKWLFRHEALLRGKFGRRLAVIDRSDRSRVQLEIACESRTEARALERNLGGRMEKLPRDWLKRFARDQRSKTLRIGQRLIILNRGSIGRSRRKGSVKSFAHAASPSHLVIPAGTAFGTGEHATTAMSLRLLEQITRVWGRDAALRRPRTAQRAVPTFHARRVRSPELNWSLLDLGTGSGIFALAAKRLGAERVLAIDNDPVAISTARANARLNKIDEVEFAVADIHRWRSRGKFDIIMANLFSELLVEVLPKIKASLKHDGTLILSGIMRAQEREVTRALRLNKFGILKTRRRGKWIAISCSRRP